MAKFLFTMLAVNDLGLPTRMVPIARALADRGRDVTIFNPAPASMKLMAEAGLKSLPMPARPMPAPVMDLAAANTAWDVEQMFAGLYADEAFVREATAVHLDLVREAAPEGIRYPVAGSPSQRK
jgi:hypothetical protein